MSASASRLMMLRGSVAQPLSFVAAGDREPILNSAGSAWAGVPFELHQTQPAEEAEVVSPLSNEHQLRIVVDGGFEGVICGGGRERVFRTTPGSVSLHTGPCSGTVRVRGSARTLVVGLPSGWLARFRHEHSPADAGICRIADRHETARLLSLAMCEEVSGGSPSGSLFGESLSMALLSCVFDRMPVGPMRVQGTLSDGQRRRLGRYIDERLGEELRLQELADVCGVGVRHFSALFRRAYGMSAHRFVWTRRLERGGELLASSSLEIAEIALVVGFSSQSHFTTAFRRLHGETPARHRRRHRQVLALPAALGPRVGRRN